MKKVYITPLIDEMVMLEEEMVCDSIKVGTNAASDDYESLSKERNTVDFSSDSDWDF